MLYIGHPDFRFKDRKKRMKVELAYGTNGLRVELPGDLDVTVIKPSFLPRLKLPELHLTRSLREPSGSPPLREMAGPGMKVSIVFSDITRPTPDEFMIGGILRELASVRGLDITLFNGLGTHRPNTEEELRAMLGPEIAATYRIVQNNAFDPSTQAVVGTTSFGNVVGLNAEFFESDLKILTGFIEPHLFAGFSGGFKAVLPGMAGLESILRNHGARMVGHPKAIWGVMTGNPIWDEIQEMAGYLGRTFLVNVALNNRREVTGIFAGDVRAAHDEGCAFVAKASMVPVPELYDIVITTNSGYPLDINLYQSVKGMRAAERVVKPGGAIIIATECRDGIPEHGMFGRLLREAGSPQEILDRINRPGFSELDQWAAQVQAIVQVKADVHIYSDGLTDEEIRACHLKPCRSIEATLGGLLDVYGRESSICILPEGQQAIPMPPPDGDSGYTHAVKS